MQGLHGLTPHASQASHGVVPNIWVLRDASVITDLLVLVLDVPWWPSQLLVLGKKLGSISS